MFSVCHIQLEYCWRSVIQNQKIASITITFVFIHFHEYACVPLYNFGNKIM